MYRTLVCVQNLKFGTAERMQRGHHGERANKECCSTESEVFIVNDMSLLFHVPKLYSMLMTVSMGARAALVMTLAIIWQVFCVLLVLMPQDNADHHIKLITRPSVKLQSD